MTREQAIALRAQMETTYAAAAPNMTTKMLIENRALCAKWDYGKHTANEIRTVENYPFKCRQDHDTEIYPDIVPGGASWATFWIPYHGLSVDTALPWIAPTGAHDMYLVGEYMIFTDGLIYRCKADTAYSPIEYADAWEVAQTE